MRDEEAKVNLLSKSNKPAFGFLSTIKLQSHTLLRASTFTFIRMYSGAIKFCHQLTENVLVKKFYTVSNSKAIFKINVVYPFLFIRFVSVFIGTHKCRRISLMKKKQFRKLSEQGFISFLKATKHPIFLNKKNSYAFGLVKQLFVFNGKCNISSLKRKRAKNDYLLFTEICKTAALVVHFP